MHVLAKKLACVGDGITSINQKKCFAICMVFTCSLYGPVEIENLWRQWHIMFGFIVQKTARLVDSIAVDLDNMANLAWCCNG